MDERHNSEQHTLTQWGDYDIWIMICLEYLFTEAGQFTATYEVFRYGHLLIMETVPATFESSRAAAQSALCIAKLDARASLYGPFPSY